MNTVIKELNDLMDGCNLRETVEIYELDEYAPYSLARYIIKLRTVKGNPLAHINLINIIHVFNDFDLFHSVYLYNPTVMLKMIIPQDLHKFKTPLFQRMIKHRYPSDGEGYLSFIVNSIAT